MPPDDVGVDIFTVDPGKQYVIINRGLARDGFENPRSPAAYLHGQFLMSYDPDFQFGLGRAEWTKDINEAMVFDSMLEAYAVPGIVSKVKPRREDGRPNRPLTAFNIECAPLSEFV